jgi:hypothetical protein
MLTQPSLTDRAERCRRRAESGDAVILICAASEVAEAQRVVGSADVIVATSAEATAFLAYMRKPAKRR